MPLSIEDISAKFDQYHAAVQGETGKIKSDIAKIFTEIEKFSETTAALQAGPTGSQQIAGNLKREQEALAAICRTGDSGLLKEIQIQAGMSVGSDPDGGYTVLPAVSSSWTKKLHDEVPMRKLARVETIGQGDAWEEFVDLNDLEAKWVGENEARPETESPKIKKIRIPLNEIYADPKVSQRLLDDTGFDLGAWLVRKCEEKFTRSEGRETISGSLPTRPQGFLTGPRAAEEDSVRAWGALQYVPSGHAIQITADGLKNLHWALRAPYRAGAVFMMNSNTAAVIDKLKDEFDQYLWRQSMVAGVPSSLLGYPVVIAEDMPDIGSNSCPIAFGNFYLGYVIVDRPGVKVLRDPYTAKPNVVFYAYKRVGGGVANSEAIKVMKIGES